MRYKNIKKILQSMCVQQSSEKWDRAVSIAVSPISWIKTKSIVS